MPKHFIQVWGYNKPILKYAGSQNIYLPYILSQEVTEGYASPEWGMKSRKRKIQNPGNRESNTEESEDNSLGDGQEKP